MDVDEFADANSANITKTLNSTPSDNIDTTRVLATPASSSVVIILLILSTFKSVIKTFNIYIKIYFNFYMYTDLTPLSFVSHKATDGFDIYAQTEYPFEPK